MTTTPPAPPATVGAHPTRRALPLALLGPVGAFAYLASTAVGGVAPPPDASLAEITRHLYEDRAGTMVAAALAALALLALLGFAAVLHRAVQDVDTTLATATVAGWLTLLAIIVLGTLPLTALSWRGVPTSPSLAYLGADLASLSGFAISAPAAFLSVAAPTLALRRGRRLPGWLLVVALAEMGINVVELAGVGARTGWNAAGYAAGLGPLVWMVWVAALGVVLARSVGDS